MEKVQEFGFRSWGGVVIKTVAIAGILITRSYSLCEITLPREGEEIEIDKDISIEVVCSPKQPFFLDTSSSGKHRLESFDPTRDDGDTARFEILNRLDQGTYKLYVLDYKGIFDTKTGEVTGVITRHDSVSIKIVRSVGIVARQNGRDESHAVENDFDLLGREVQDNSRMGVSKLPSAGHRRQPKRQSSQ